MWLRKLDLASPAVLVPKFIFHGVKAAVVINSVPYYVIKPELKMACQREMKYTPFVTVQIHS